MTPFLVWTTAVAAWLLLLAPALLYLRTGWVARRRRLDTLLTPEVLNTFFCLFWPSLRKEADLKATFEKRYTTTYGRKHFVVPLLVLALITAVGLWMTARTLLAWSGLTSDPHPVPAIVVAAFIGAYVWVTQDQLNRLRTQDFTIHEVWAGSYRFVLAVPLAYSLTAILNEGAAAPVAFLLGAFPTKLLMTIARRTVSKRLQVGESEETGISELIQLQCVGKSQAERFEDEGYVSVAQLAWADPVDVTLRTNFNFYFVFDCQNQALLWVYLGAQVKDLYRYSLRGAQEATYLLERLSSDDKTTKDGATAALAAAAKVLGMEPAALWATLAEVRDDPYSKFLCDLWPEKVTNAPKPASHLAA